MNRFLNVIIRQLFRRGMQQGMQSIARGGKNFSDMTTEERQQANATQQQMNQGRRALNIARRFMR